MIFSIYKITSRQTKTFRLRGGVKLVVKANIILLCMVLCEEKGGSTDIYLASIMCIASYKLCLVWGNS